jgi:hypothetical protein
MLRRLIYLRSSLMLRMLRMLRMLLMLRMLRMKMTPRTLRQTYQAAGALSRSAGWRPSIQDARSANTKRLCRIFLPRLVCRSRSQR